MYLTGEQMRLLEEMYPQTYNALRENNALRINYDDIAECIKEAPSVEVKADYISIGFHISNIMNCELDCSDAEKIGIEFCNMFFAKRVPRHVLKELRFDRLGIQLVRYLIRKECSYTKNVTVYDAALTSKCHVQIINKPDLDKLKHEPFYKRDLLGICDNYIVFDGLESLYSKSAMALLKKIMNAVGDVPIVIQAGYMYRGDYECINNSSYLFNLPETLASMYETIGFVNVNNHIGCYEDSVIMIKCSDKLMSEIIKM